MNEECHSADFQGILALALGFGATRAGIVSVGDISFSESFRHLCEMNHCGHYGINWMCPPAVGEFETLRNQVLKFEQGLVIQTVASLEDSFDYEGMVRAADRHDPFLKYFLPAALPPNALCVLIQTNAHADLDHLHFVHHSYPGA